MEEPQDSSSVVCFGAFEADLRARELRRDGVKVQLQQQPFQVLAALLERPGQLITRDELRRLVWSTDTFVDFDRGLNKAINRLRNALGDRAHSPKILETLPRRGYRFLVAVSRSIGSVAVLPFENVSGDTRYEYWADGVTEELIAHLARVGGVKVISRTSCMHFKTSHVPLPEIARQLNVEAIIEGSVAVANRKVRIRAQLIYAPQDRLLWASAYERNLADALTLQDQIARAIAVQVRGTLMPGRSLSRTSARPSGSAAYEAYLRGRFFWNKRTQADVNRGIRHFRKAVALNPEFAAAHAGLADSYVVLGILGLLRPRDAFPKANAAAKRALELDETLAETHATLGHIRMLYDWDWRGAEKEFKEALDLDSNCSTAHLWYGNLLALRRRNKEAIAELNAARGIDPLSVPVNALLGFVYMRTGQYDLALQACRGAIEFDPNNPFGHWILARVFDVRNELRKALTESKKADELSRGALPFAAHLGYAYARIRNKLRAHKVIEHLTKTSTHRYVSPYLIALIYTGLGQKDLAFEWLEKAYSDRAARLTELCDPPFDNMRSDPRFRGLSQRVGLLPA